MTRSCDTCAHRRPCKWRATIHEVLQGSQGFMGEARKEGPVWAAITAPIGVTYD